MKNRSSLLRLAVVDRKECVCGVCDRMRLVVVRDVSTGWFVCEACVEPSLVAERVMALSLKVEVKK